MMKRLLTMMVPGAVIAVAVGGSLVALALSWGRGESVVQAEAGIYLAIDADIGNGNRPCDPIDPEATVGVGWEHTVGLCLVNNPGASNPAAAIDALELEIIYDSGLNAGVVDAGMSPDYLDANPDANDGSGSTKLGTGWTCDPVPGVTTPPTMGPPAYIICSTLVGTRELTAEPGLLATLTFDVVGQGDDVLSFSDGSNVYGDNCPPVGGLTCPGATIHKVSTPGGPPPPTRTPTPSPGPPSGGAGGPVAAFQQRCSTAQPGKVEVVFLWQPSKAGSQWMDLSLFNNGFAPGTFVGIGPLPPDRWAFVWDGLLPGRAHYLRVNTLTSNGWAPSQTLAFTTGACGGPALLGDVTQSCGGQPGTVDGTFRWTPADPAGSVQWLDLSLYNNGFAPGTFLNAGPLGPAAGSLTWAGLRSGLVHYWRVNTLTPGGWKVSSTGSFVTGTCG
jgi:hypothetical protein